MQRQQRQALEALLQRQEWSSYRQLLQQHKDRRLALHLLEELSFSLVQLAESTPEAEWESLYLRQLQAVQSVQPGLWRFLLRLSQPAVADEVQVIAKRLQAIRKAAIYGPGKDATDTNSLWLEATRRSYTATLWLIALLFLLYWGLVG